MESNELNEKIREICDNRSMAYEAFGGKTIPYIGWYWRDVDFDCDTYSFGVMPPELPEYYPCVGFMENNKWGYRYVTAEKDEWIKIKDLLIAAVQSPDTEKLKLLNEEIQKLSRKPWTE